MNEWEELKPARDYVPQCYTVKVNPWELMFERGNLSNVE
jgi:hypothetical protein